jgi:hypothetical protein
MAAGLTMGLLSLEKTKLEIRTMIGDSEEASAARSVLPLVKRHHLLLVTLLLFNAVANEAMPIFLEKLVPGYVAVLLSVTLVLIFGEVKYSTSMCTIIMQQCKSTLQRIVLHCEIK